MFTKGNATDCDHNVSTSLFQKTALGKDIEPNVQLQYWDKIVETNFGVGATSADPMEHERIDESRCYFCQSEEHCDLCTQTRMKNFAYEGLLRTNMYK